MALTSRISLQGPPTSEPEDFLSSSLGVIFPDDVTNQHGDAEHSLAYASPHLPRPLHIALSDPDQENDRKLFSHYLWNASLLLAEFIEAGSLRLNLDVNRGELEASNFDVAGLTCLELGAGTALPSLMAALLGATDVVVTDYPSETVLATLRKNVAANAKLEHSPRHTLAPTIVNGHSWGELTTPFATAHQARFDRVFVCDCLWMPWQHTNLHRSIAWFLKFKSASSSARAWVVAGFHTGRAKMRGFFEPTALVEAGLEVEALWERDCDGVERDWVWDRGQEDVSERKRWLVVGVLRRRAERVEG
ncbi:uncharacterized protein GGS22DRAFT_173490 [Annulohypoxylon maeteangense]|uniref:uncharacterized protein n=1 Tax=Annulohypoxylon maeteangense TaxID=1927788 RepID=UPI002008C7E8|nr:uncharacterized protein GGS22DRAFT_173490 [Annulohypoxylon maeteangense]KAI0881150.1 hypothetical protein GGS22DRAFT_173490 [Annulohypoxylon maeteangense]